MRKIYDITKWGRELLFQIGECLNIFRRGRNPSNHPTTQPTVIARKVKILIADDHEVIRQALRKVIEIEEDLMVIAEASDGREAIKLARETSPDIIIMDVNMPVMNGIQATRAISVEMPTIDIIGLSLNDDLKIGRSMKNAGASVYLTKNKISETLCTAIRSEAINVK